ncbi:unnamed protein product [Cuscuta epithymum]|uniref:F-box domain-containing protein n=1 Tax=Cuscuta epithymum TaxID=186058 RepID=A0AAV0EC58_9ASTE|nr:unnamed protein product [Cuscuta epithymum]CAH9133931.1 unnamed protein product [Cuscuta epithymum]
MARIFSGPALRRQIITPPEINRDIFLRLPPKSLLRSQFVCEEWRSQRTHVRKLRLLVVQVHHLIISRLQPTSSLGEPLLFPKGKYLNYEESWPSPLCSCNGLLLLRAGTNFLLWNPLSGWGRGRHVLHHSDLDRDYSVLAGMSYDASTDDYKVVLLLRHSSADYGYGGRFVEFASVRTKMWRPVTFPYNLRTAEDGVSFRNRLHWLVSDVKRLRDFEHDDGHEDFANHCPFEGWVWEDFSECNKIAYFDPVDDEFKTLPCPSPCNPEEEDSIVGLGIINDCLCMARRDNKNQTIEVLIMREYGKGESWFRLFHIYRSIFEGGDHFYGLTFFSPEESAKVLFIVRGYHNETAYVYDPVAGEDKQVMKEDLAPNSSGDDTLAWYMFLC